MNKIYPYIYDFLSQVFEEESLKNEIKEIILFGSVAKNTYDKKSDIDLFFHIKNKEKIREIEETIKKILKIFEIKAEKTWHLKKMNFPINILVGSLNDELWKGIKDEIASSGIILYSGYKELPEKINHYLLFSYSLNNLKRKDKMRIIRTLLGYKLKKGKKEYIQKGILGKINGIKLASNVVLVPMNESIKLKKIFNENKINYKVFDSWIRI